MDVGSRKPLRARELLRRRVERRSFVIHCWPDGLVCRSFCFDLLLSLCIQSFFFSCICRLRSGLKFYRTLSIASVAPSGTVERVLERFNAEQRAEAFEEL